MPDSDSHDSHDSMPRSIDPGVYHIGSGHNWNVKSPSVADFHERHPHFKDGSPTAPDPLGSRQNTPPGWSIWDTAPSGQGHILRPSPQPKQRRSSRLSSDTRTVRERPDSTRTQLNGSLSKATNQPPSRNVLNGHGFTDHGDPRSLQLLLQRQQQNSTDALSSGILRRADLLAESHGVTKGPLPDRTTALEGKQE